MARTTQSALVALLLSWAGTGLVARGQVVPDVLIPSAPTKTTIEIRAQSTVGPGAKIALKVGGKRIAKFKLSEEMATYTTEIVKDDFNFYDDVVVKYVNDDESRNAVVESIKIGSEDVRNAEYVLNTGAYTDGSGCGTGLSTEISCPGTLNFGGIFKKQRTLVVRAKGYSSSEIVQLSVGGNLVARFKLDNEFKEYKI